MIVPPEYTPGYFVPDHWPVHDPEGKEIGYVTSKCFSPRLKKNIAYAFVPIENSDKGTKFFIHSPYAKMECVVVDLPFWDPKKQIPVGKA